MGRPIPAEGFKRVPREERRSRLERAPANHAEAMLAGYEVLQGLHDRGVLELLRGLLGGGDDVLQAGVEAMKTPEAIRGLRNLLILTKVCGAIDPDVLKKFAEAVPDALAAAAKAQENDPPGFGGRVRILCGRHFGRGLAMMSGVLEALG